MRGQIKIGIILGIIAGCALGAVLHQYSNYKKEKAIQTEESSSITNADYNDTTIVTTTSKTTTTTTTTTTSQTTTTTISKVPIKWVKTNSDSIDVEVNGVTTFSGVWNGVPDKISLNYESDFSAPDYYYNNSFFTIDVWVNPDADYKYMLKVLVYDEPLDMVTYSYSDTEAKVTISGWVSPMYINTIDIYEKSTNTCLKSISVNAITKQFWWRSSNEDVISFDNDKLTHTIHKPGKTTISFMYGNEVVVQKEVEVVE